jgi:hypothetical protein
VVDGMLQSIFDGLIKLAVLMGIELTFNVQTSFNTVNWLPITKFRIATDKGLTELTF